MSASDFGVATWALLAVSPVIGSFLGVLVRRLPEGGTVVRGRSRCESCNAALGPRDLVPLASWAILRGRCRHCGARIGWFYPGIEIAALLVAVIALAADDMPRAALDCLLGWWLLALAWIDLRCWLLPDALTLPLIVSGLGVTALCEPEALLDRGLGALLGYLILRGVAMAYRAWRGVEGIGGGDAKLLAAGGAWVGALALPQLVAGAASAGLFVAGALHLGGRRLQAQSALPFGPFLALAIWLIWLFDRA
jgi:leader peptidase (prepilin peptidase)/N-methyltransferase